MRRYNPKEIEPKWQKNWADSKIYEAKDDSSKPKKYILEYFPYPSGAAMHVGHVRNYTIGDAMARHYRMQGFEVLHPMGWDSFGLPAENYAIKNNISPRQAIDENTGKFKQQLIQMGFSYDWAREIDSSDPNYYKWTQSFFELLFEKGLAYQKESLQWWCEHDKTVLANEQVEQGLCWRCGNPVTKKSLNQWFFKILDYADRLSEDLEKLDWSDSIKSMQRNWIGKSKGAEINFALKDSKEVLTVFTTRPDTLYGATFMVIAPEHPLVETITSAGQKADITQYIKEAQAKSDVERQEQNREKTGCFTGAYAINPATKKEIPVWIADYVLPGYGTGAIMAVPAHDERDYEFAKKFNLEIIEVVAPDFGKPLPDPVDVTGPVVVGYDPKIKQYMSLINTKNNMRWFAAGGLEDGETYEQAAHRELAEEAGFKKVEKMIQLGGPNYSYFYNSNKNSNRRSFSYMFLAIIDKEDQEKQALESHEAYEVVWSDVSEILKDLEAIPEGRGHWIDGMKRAQDAVAAYELGHEYEFIYKGEGVLFNSGPYNRVTTFDAREKIIVDLEKENVAKEVTNYKIRDWLISRQRYWGAPIPIIHCPEHGAVAVPKDQLPVVLPEVESYQPNGEGTSVLAGVTDWVHTTCPTCGGPAKRETDTMDGFACSSWYFLRFADPFNSNEPFSKEKATYWLPVDDYIGGAEHAVMHLLYARMWTKVMFDEGMIEFDEPFLKLRNQGMILAPDGNKMSKSKGNVIAPDELIDQGYGADSVRIMELFIGPWNQEAAWSVTGIAGAFRFLQRTWNLVQEVVEAKDDTPNDDIKRPIHKAIKKVTTDMGDMGFNTALASLMECVNELFKIKADKPVTTAWKQDCMDLLRLLAPFAPHIADELWSDLGNKQSVHVSEWPKWDEAYLIEDMMTIAVQVNGKLRGTVTITKEANQEDVIAVAVADEKVKTYITSEPKKTIYVPGKLVSLVV